MKPVLRRHALRFFFSISFLFWAATTSATSPLPSPTPTPSPARSPYLPSWMQNGPLGSGAHDFKCGPRPILKPECQVTACESGAWKVECDERGAACGAPPIVSIGCILEGCVDGVWKTKCD